MKKFVGFVGILGILIGISQKVVATTENEKEKILTNMASMRVPFVENKGQTDESVRFYARTFAGTLFVSHEGELIYSLEGKEARVKGQEVIGDRLSVIGMEQESSPESRTPNPIVFKESLVGATKIKIQGEEEAQTKVNYFVGNNKDNWRTNLPTYNSVSLGEVFEDIEVQLKAYGNNVEKLFYVYPGANPEKIKVKIDGALKLNINEQGELVITTQSGEVKFSKPVAYQEIDGIRKEVGVAYLLHNTSNSIDSENPQSPLVSPLVQVCNLNQAFVAEENCFGSSYKLEPTGPIAYQEIDGKRIEIVCKFSLNGSIYGFSVGDYNKEYPLIIDPLLASTFMGGSGEDISHSIAIGSGGDVYVTGWTNSPSFPTTLNGYDTSYNGYYDVFISKLDSNLSEVITSIFHNATAILGIGNKLVVTMEGYPQGTASFAVSNQATTTMTEISSGRYIGTYTVQQGDNIITGTVTGFLTIGTLIYTRDATLTVTLDGVLPTSTALPLPEYSGASNLKIPYTAWDNSGLKQISLYKMKEGGTWTYHTYQSISGTFTTGTFTCNLGTGTDGRWFFYTRAKDIVNNEESFTGSDTSVIVDTTKPATPTLISVTNPAIGGRLAFSWTSGTDTNLAGYIVHYGTQSGNYTGSKTISGTDTTYTLGTLTNGTLYYIAISAYDKAENKSDKSNELYGTPTVAADTITSIVITPATQNIAVGSTFTCQVKIKDVKQLRGGDLFLNFNPDIFRVIEIGNGTFIPPIASQYNNTNGTIDYSFGLYTGSATGSGVLCSIIFQAISGGTSSVVFNLEGNNRKTKLINVENKEITLTKEEALYYAISSISIFPKNKVAKADELIDYTCIGYCNSLELDVTGSTTFTANGGGSWTLNSFLTKYIGTYTIKGEYPGFIGTTAVIINNGTPTTLFYLSGSGQVGTCTNTLKDPFIVKVEDKYGNPCNGVGVNWQIISYPSGATGQSISPTNTTTNIQGISLATLTLGTEPPGTYVIHAISTGLAGSPCTFTASSLRQFGNIAGFCMLKLGTTTFGTSSDITVRIVELSTTTTTNNESYFIFENIPVGTYTLTFDTWGASSATKTNICIGSTQFENTTDIGTISLLAGDINNDGNVTTADWPYFVNDYYAKEGDANWQEAKKGDFNHDGQVNIDDFGIFADNFGDQQKGRVMAMKLASMPTKAKKTAGNGAIALSFNLETLEGVNMDDLRIGDFIYLEVTISDAKNYLGGEIHLSFNPDVLQVVDTNETKAGIQICPGYFPAGSSAVELKNEVDNSVGKIDYAVVVWKPEEGDGGLLAKVKFKVISCGDSSKVRFDSDEAGNRRTIFVEKSTQEEIGQEVDVTSPEEITIKVPVAFNNLDSTLVYPNPARKGEIIKIGNLPNNERISLKIFNMAGELVLEKEEKSINNTITWDLRNYKDNEVASGIYVYSIATDNERRTGKIGVIR